MNYRINSSRWDIVIDTVGFSLKNNQITLISCFTLMPKTDMGLPKTGIIFYCVSAVNWNFSLKCQAYECKLIWYFSDDRTILKINSGVTREETGHIWVKFFSLPQYKTTKTKKWSGRHGRPLPAKRICQEAFYLENGPHGCQHKRYSLGATIAANLGKWSQQNEPFFPIRRVCNTFAQCGPALVPTGFWI